jgi:hypothetical protein
MEYGAHDIIQRPVIAENILKHSCYHTNVLQSKPVRIAMTKNPGDARLL